MAAQVASHPLAPTHQPFNSFLNRNRNPQSLSFLPSLPLPSPTGRQHFNLTSPQSQQHGSTKFLPQEPEPEEAESEYQENRGGRISERTNCDECDAGTGTAAIYLPHTSPFARAGHDCCLLAITRLHPPDPIPEHSKGCRSRWWSYSGSSSIINRGGGGRDKQ